jgi:hypothetical protein
MGASSGLLKKGLSAGRLVERARSRRVPSGRPESLKPAEHNGGASAAGRDVGWVPTPASGLEVCRCFESLASMSATASRTETIAAFSATPHSKKARTGINERQAVVHDRNCAVAIRVVVYAALSCTPSCYQAI